MGRFIFFMFLLFIGYLFKNDILIYDSYSNNVSINLNKIPLNELVQQLKNIDLSSFKR